MSEQLEATMKFGVPLAILAWLAFYLLRPLIESVREWGGKIVTKHEAFLDTSVQTNQTNSQTLVRMTDLYETHVKAHDTLAQTLDGYADVAELATDLIPEHHKETAEEIRERIRRLRNRGQ